MQRGTLENMLARPVHPLEVMIGKILPCTMVGHIQVAVILVTAHYLFSVPIAGSLPLLLICVLASGVSIRMALAVDPAEAIGG